MVSGRCLSPQLSVQTSPRTVARRVAVVVRVVDIAPPTPAALGGAGVCSSMMMRAAFWLMRRAPGRGRSSVLSMAGVLFCGTVGMVLGLAACQKTRPSPVSADPQPTVRSRPETENRSRGRQSPEPAADCVPAGPEICGRQCGTLSAGCGEVVACGCAADETCADGRCEPLRVTDPPPDPRPDRVRPLGKCSCCVHHGGAYISPQRHRAQQEAFRKCIADGGACEGSCPIPASARRK